MKVLCYGVRDVEKPFFEELNKEYNFELTLVGEYLNSVESAKLAMNHDAVILRGNCFATKEVLDMYKEYGVKYVLTRTVGINHIDIEYARSLGMKMAYVPFYSPNAIAELALTQAMMLVRNMAYTANMSSNKKFKVTNQMFSSEIRNLTVGIIGLGRIGFTAAKLFKGLGAKVLGYDVFKKDGVEEVLDQVSLDDLIKNSDVISLHVPYIKENGVLVTKEFLSKMKKGSILINTSRGENVDTYALIEALKSNHLSGAGLDTINDEAKVFFKDFDQSEKLPSPFEELTNMYPRVLISPHIGSFTDEAVKNMIETSYENLDEFIKTGDCKNKIWYMF